MGAVFSVILFTVRLGGGLNTQKPLFFNPNLYGGRVQRHLVHGPLRRRSEHAKHIFFNPKNLYGAYLFRKAQNTFFKRYNLHLVIQTNKELPVYKCQRSAQKLSNNKLYLLIGVF